MSRIKTASVIAAALALATASSLRADLSFGTLDNFDVINDTGQDCHGFEIELEGVHKSDIYATFGAPYIRYGDPTIFDTATGVLIRYASTYDTLTHTWAATTSPLTPGGTIVTGGHSLYDPTYGGDPGYPNVPGDHFGIALNGNATKQIYRWLWGDAQGNLINSAGLVKLPAPVMTITPPAVVGQQPNVNAVVVAPPNLGNKKFGDAIWVKVFVTESHIPEELENLVAGNPMVPGRDANGGIEPSETEIEWQLLQSGGDNAQLESGEIELDAGSESITRRYEFYAYTGAYDPDHEALNEQPGANDLYVGAFLGSQNVALNVDAFQVVPEPASLAVLGLAGSMVLRRRRATR